jgi:hypothetical protein
VTEGPVDPDWVTELGQRDGLSQLHPQFRGAGRSRPGQPQPRAAAEGQELSLLGVRDDVHHDDLLVATAPASGAPAA